MDENNEKIEWIQQLQKEALEPRMNIVEIVETREEAIEKEKRWIQHLSSTQKTGSPAFVVLNNKERVARTGLVGHSAHLLNV